MKILPLSDLHLDFYATKYTTKTLQTFCTRTLELDTVEFDCITIAGDLGHSNGGNKLLLKYLRDTYNVPVLFTYGNHDLYFVSSSQRNKYYNHSYNRVEDMANFAATEEDIYFLDGSIQKINGVSIGGVANWYDCSYLSPKDPETLWHKGMNDSRLILHHGNVYESPLEIRKYLNVDEKLKAVLSADYIFSHVLPILEPDLVMPQYRDDPFTSFYMSDSKNIIFPNNAKYWQFGHMHHSLSKTINKTVFFNASLGYPSESLYFKPRTVQV